jgi:hypothetical protein
MLNTEDETKLDFYQILIFSSVLLFLFLVYDYSENLLQKKFEKNDLISIKGVVEAKPKIFSKMSSKSIDYYVSLKLKSLDEIIISSSKWFDKQSFVDDINISDTITIRVPQSNVYLSRNSLSLDNNPFILGLSKNNVEYMDFETYSKSAKSSKLSLIFCSLWIFLCLNYYRGRNNNPKLMGFNVSIQNAIVFGILAILFLSNFIKY